MTFVENSHLIAFLQVQTASKISEESLEMDAEFSFSFLSLFSSTKKVLINLSKSSGTSVHVTFEDRWRELYLLIQENKGFWGNLTAAF